MVIARCASHAFSSIVMNGDLCTLALSHTSNVAPVPGTASLHDELAAEVKRRVHAVDAILEENGVLLHVAVVQSDHHQRDSVVVGQTVIVGGIHGLAFRANTALSSQL